MILQTHPRLRKEIQMYGCYYMSLLWHAVIRGGAILDVDTINEELYSVFIRRGWMTETCFINNPAAIVNSFGVNVRSVNKRPAEYLCNDNELEILQFKVVDSMSHFVAGDSFGNVTYDPYGLSNSVRNGACISKRIMELR